MAILVDTVTGPLYQADGNADGPIRKGRMGSVVATDAHGRYYEAASRGNTFALNVAAGAGQTAFTGAAGGTPLLGVMNPLGSGKLLALVFASVIPHVSAATSTVLTSFSIFGGPSVLPTGTATNPTCMLSQLAFGSVARGFVNTAMTSSTAIGQIMAMNTYFFTATSVVGAFLSAGTMEMEGMIVAYPGNLLALGCTIALTTVTYDAALIWEEIPL